MNKGFIQHFSNGLNELSDLKMLAHSDLAPYFDQISHTMFQLKQCFELEQRPETLEAVKDVLELKIHHMLKQYFLSATTFATMAYRPRFTHLSTTSWDGLLTYFPKILELLQLLRVQDLLAVDIFENRVEVKSRFNFYAINNEAVQRSFEKLCREILSKNYFLTVNHHKQEGVGGLELVFYFSQLNESNGFTESTESNRSSEVNQRGYYFELNKRKIGIPSYYLAYLQDINFKEGLKGSSKVGDDQISQNSQDHFQSFGSDISIELTDDFSFIYNRQSVAVLIQQTRQHLHLPNYLDFKKIFYFPFLFKSISLIIPIRGKFLPIDGEKIVVDQEDDIQKKVLHQQVNIDLQDHPTDHIYSFDIFKSLF